MNIIMARNSRRRTSYTVAKPTKLSGKWLINEIPIPKREVFNKASNIILCRSVINLSEKDNSSHQSANCHSTKYK